MHALELPQLQTHLPFFTAAGNSELRLHLPMTLSASRRGPHVFGERGA